MGGSRGLGATGRLSAAWSLLGRHFGGDPIILAEAKCLHWRQKFQVTALLNHMCCTLVAPFGGLSAELRDLGCFKLCLAVIDVTDLASQKKCFGNAQNGQGPGHIDANSW